LLALFLGSYSVRAQDTLAKPLNKEFGFNALPLVTSFLPFDTNPIQNFNDFSLILRRKKENQRLYRRTALSISLRTNRDIETNLLKIRKGIERKIPVTSKWIFHYGGDFFLSISDQNLFANSRAELGLAGLYGVQFMLNDRAALGTEGYLELGITNSGLSLQLSQPKSVVLSIYF